MKDKKNTWVNKNRLHACVMMELKFIENPTLIYKIKAAIIEKSNL
jgi:hypothetical protein